MMTEKEWQIIEKAADEIQAKFIGDIKKQAAKEILEELDNRLWDDIDTNSDIGGAAHNQTIRSLIKWIKRKYSVEVEE